MDVRGNIIRAGRVWRRLFDKSRVSSLSSPEKEWSETRLMRLFWRKSLVKAGLPEKL